MGCLGYALIRYCINIQYVEGVKSDAQGMQTKTMSSPKQTRVIKKLSPGQPGTVKLAQRFGDALVCVRYRLDAEPRNMRRYTTVELVVDQGPPTDRTFVKVRIPDIELRRRAIQHGAVWDAKLRLWRMRYGLAKSLGLVDRTFRK